MGKFSILLCDSDEVYSKRLATGLQKQFREQVSVRTCSNVFDRNGQAIEADLLLGSRLPEEAWRQKHPHCIYVLLDEGETPGCGMVEEDGTNRSAVEDVSKLWKGSVFKYQSVSKIARVLQAYLPAQTKGMAGTGVGLRQVWYGVVSPVRHESMIPFACTLAGAIGKEKRVLLVVLMEFSGILALLELEPGWEMEALLLRLRQRESLQQIPFPGVYVLQDFDLLNGPENPMILYELSELDITRLMERIQDCRQYDAVVWVGGNMMRGIGELFCRSEKVFSIEKTDAYSKCCQKEFEQFFNKLLPGDSDCLVNVRLPILSGNQTGEHLLWQWNRSVIGDAVRRHLKGDMADGIVDGNVTKEDFRTIGPERRDFGRGADGADPWSD